MSAFDLTNPGLGEATAAPSAFDTRSMAETPDDPDARLARARGQVFMMPFAGAPAYAYAALLPPRGHPARDRFRQLSLPGHGDRLREPLVEDLDRLAADVFASIAGDLRPEDVLFGHSMGALLAWLVARRARSLLFPLPRALVVSGMGGPATFQPRGRHRLDRNALREELRRLGGSPDAVLDDDEVFAFFEPQVRADFKAVETHRYRAEPPLPLPITVLLGDADDVTGEAARAWARETTHPLHCETWSGGHFFLFQHGPRLRSRLADALTAPPGRTAPAPQSAG